MTPEPALPPSAVRPASELPVFPTNLPETDGEPLDSDWHRLAMNLLLAVLWYHFRDRRDFFAGGNMFLYFSEEQVRNKDYRGPDFFFVWGADRDKRRRYYALWEEGGLYPNVIIELLSPSTAEVDRTIKKDIYDRVFRTPEYFLYDPDSGRLEGWRRTNGAYEPIEPEENGRLWSKHLELYLGTWEGRFQETRAVWPRFYDVHGNLILAERESEKYRADVAEAEVARLRAELAKLRAQQGQSGSPTQES